MPVRVSEIDATWAGLDIDEASSTDLLVCWCGREECTAPIHYRALAGIVRVSGEVYTFGIGEERAVKQVGAPLKSGKPRKEKYVSLESIAEQQAALDLAAAQALFELQQSPDYVPPEEGDAAANATQAVSYDLVFSTSTRDSPTWSGSVDGVNVVWCPENNLCWGPFALQNLLAGEVQNTSLFIPPGDESLSFRGMGMVGIHVSVLGDDSWFGEHIDVFVNGITTRYTVNGWVTRAPANYPLSQGLSLPLPQWQVDSAFPGAEHVRRVQFGPEVPDGL